MRALLVNPPETGVGGFTPPPLNLLYLAGMLEHHGIRCDVVDGNLEGWTGVHNAIRRAYDVIGVTAITHSRWKSFAVCTMARKLSPKSMTVLGGVHASVLPEQCRRFADVVVQGEGEQQLLDICRGKHPAGDMVPIDSIPFPAWEKIDIRRYPGRGLTKHDPRSFNGVKLSTSPRISVMASRSCTAHCTFCSSWWVQGPYRMRDPRLVVDELEFLTLRGARHFRFVDARKALEFCAEVARLGLRIAYQVQTRADALNQDLVEALRDSGCYLIALGVETGNDTLLEGLHKSIDTAEVERVMRMCRRVGVRVEANMIVGNIGETDRTIDDTRRFLRRTKPAVVVATGGLAIFPGTAIYQRALKERKITAEFWDSTIPFMIYDFSPQQIARWVVRVKGYNMFMLLKYYLGKCLDMLQQARGNYTKQTMGSIC
jgi:anaerobic magnesium-protoporphyrin IX monomethyl ester cyclase